MPPRKPTAKAGARVTGSEAGTPCSELLVRRSVSHPARGGPRAISGSARRRAVRRANLNRYVIAGNPVRDGWSGASRQSLGRRRRTGRRLIGRSDARVKAGALTRWSWNAVLGAGVCPAAFVDYRTGINGL